MATGRHSYAIAFTMELGRWYLCTLTVYSDAHRTLTGRWSLVTVRVHLPIKTAMEERQARERERYMRPIARAASGDCKMSSYITP